MTHTAMTTTRGETAARRLADAAERLEPEPMGVGVFELEDGSGLWEVGLYFETAPDETALALLAAAFGARPFAVSALPETDWVAKVRRDLSPVEAGRFFVHGGHDADRVPPGRVALLIEAAMAFGTGHHGTTQGCLRALDRMADGPAPGPVLDVGCGTAVLTMAAARVWSGAPAVASDIDPVAIDVARANIAANGLEGRIVTAVADGVDHPAIASAAPFGLIFANILMAPLIDLAPELERVATPGATAILSGLLNDQADAVSRAYGEAGFKVSRSEVLGDWTTLALTRAG